MVSSYCTTLSVVSSSRRNYSTDKSNPFSAANSAAIQAAYKAKSKAPLLVVEDGVRYVVQVLAKSMHPENDASRFGAQLNEMCTAG